MEKEITKLDRTIVKIAKKLNIFTLNELNALIESVSKVELVKSLEKLVSQKILKKDKSSYLYIPPKYVFSFYNGTIPSKIDEFNPEGIEFPEVETNKDKCEDNIEEQKNLSKKDELEVLIKHLTPPKVIPKQIYVKHFYDIMDYYKYFFAPPEIRQNILDDIKMLIETQDLKQYEIDSYCCSHNLTRQSIQDKRYIITISGFSSYLNDTELCDPLEVYEYFKAYYLTPEQLNAKEALELAILKFEELLMQHFERETYADPREYLKALLNEYSKEEIRNFRRSNFSEFSFKGMV